MPCCLLFCLSLSLSLSPPAHAHRHCLLAPSLALTHLRVSSLLSVQKPGCIVMVTARLRPQPEAGRVRLHHQRGREHAGGRADPGPERRRQEVLVRPPTRVPTPAPTLVLKIVISAAGPPSCPPRLPCGPLPSYSRHRLVKCLQKMQEGRPAFHAPRAPVRQGPVASR